MIELRREGSVAIVQMRSGENRFNPTFISELMDALDEAEHADEPTALVLTGEGRVRAGEVLSGMLGIFARILGSPIPSVAALNGHAFAGGAMLALACDFRVMRTDRGFFCLSLIHI